FIRKWSQIRPLTTAEVKSALRQTRAQNLTDVYVELRTLLVPAVSNSGARLMLKDPKQDLSAMLETRQGANGLLQVIEVIDALEATGVRVPRAVYHRLWHRVERYWTKWSPEARESVIHALGDIDTAYFEQSLNSVMHNLRTQLTDE